MALRSEVLACARKPRREFLDTAILVYSGEVGRVRLNANVEHDAWLAEKFRVTYKMHGPTCRTRADTYVVNSPAHSGA
jgi:hypothetical protein